MHWKHLARGLLGGIILTVVLHAAAAEDTGEGVDAEGAALAEDEDIDWSDWRPSVAVELGFFSHEPEGSMNAGFFTSFFESKKQGSCPRNIRPEKGSAKNATFPIQGSDSTRVDMATIPVSFEMTGPALKALPGDPRPFAYIGYAFPRENEQQVAIDLSPGGPILEGFFEAELKYYWFAGIGADFTVRMLDYDVHIKPALGYVEQRVETSAIIREANRQNPNIILNSTASSVDSLRGIGPRLGVDVELGRRGPIAISFIADTTVAWIFNERKFEFSGFNQDGLPDPRINPSGAQCAAPGSCPQEPFTIEYDPISITAGAGLRFTWVGW